ncbi:TIGR00730 family Rossman fold protein [Candidatus Uhrbacteria bacterium]|nr:TIGR00730 family Rossman fold protein [Candidatus Uhrbacteria bacterium]
MKPSKKPRGPKVAKSEMKRFTSWLCSPGNVCMPVEERPFTEDPQWRVFRIMAEFIEGFEFLSKLENEVTIFGSARTMPDDPAYKAARELGFLLGKNGYSVITGGGPGIMEAANRGAHEAGGVSVGLDIELPKGQRRNEYADKAMGFHYFFTRKVMLSASAQAYVFFPGGFGTLDEMSEMITLIQTGKIPPEVPLILVGRAYWQPFIDWLETTVCRKHKNIGKADLAIIRLVDTPKEAFAIIRKTSERSFG